MAGIQERSEPPVLLNFDEGAVQAQIRRGLALRPQIEAVMDDILDGGADSIWFIGIGGTYASCMQAEVYAKHRTAFPVYCENAAEFLTTGNRRFTDRSVVILSSESGTTKEMIALTDHVHRLGAKVFGFIDTPGSELTRNGHCDWLIVSPKNEQLKFFMCIRYLMYRRGEFPEYAGYNDNMETYLAEALAAAEKSADSWARRYARELAEYRETHPDMPHYFVAAGNQYGAACSYGMCYWEEQLWIRTRVVSCAEFFHGMLEVIEKDTPVTLFMGEDEQRPLAERVAKFLPVINTNHVVIDTKQYTLNGIREEYRGSVSHLVMRAVNSRVDTYMEYYMRHPMTIRRYYRQFDY